MTPEAFGAVFDRHNAAVHAQAWRERNQRGWAGLLGHCRAACSVTL